MSLYYYVYLGHIKTTLVNQFDVKYRDIETPRGKITLVYIEDMTANERISHYIIGPLQSVVDDLANAEDIKRTILRSSEVSDVKSPEDAIESILSGKAIVLFEFLTEVLSCDVKKFSKRAVKDPAGDAVSQGPQEGFNEVLLDNVCLIRRRVKNPNLRLERFVLGRSSQTTVVLAYIEGTAPPELIRLLRRKLSAIDIDFILDVSYIDEQLKTSRTVFDTLTSSERPDTVAAHLFEGRAAILVDGTSFALIAPTFFMEIFQAADDYYLNKYTADFARLLRVMSLFVSLMLPGLYVALTTNHLNLLPTTIALTIATSRAVVPFPIVAEVLLMLMFFEFTKKAGKRLPTQIGPSLSIVSALILGQAAINAGLTSDSTVVVMGVYAITSFINPKIASGSSMWSVFIITLSAALGLQGFFVGLILMAGHLASLKSCGYPYFFPLGTAKRFYSKDFLFRSDLENISSGILKRGENS
ncbi:spore germination protein [Sporomusa sp.]|uniref:spore germination protein n=1 Tax=Sporomusa sp. TaxID=2078658 RepID=UPI002C0FEE56|nr:spore germination protein [Sporomusa sp.]HWR44288.1 spore germination protein [Sporomusa sp.]